MRQSLKNVLLIALLTVQAAAVGAGTRTHSSNNATTTETTSFDWSHVMEAIIEVESNGRHDAENGTQIGAMQITPILVKDCNRILSQRGEKHRYTLKDRYNVEKSKEMFCLIQSFYNPTNNVEKAIRSWNGGQNYSTKATQRYFEKVKLAMKK